MTKDTILSREIADEMLYALVNSLHAQVFGVHSLGDPNHSHNALSDEGEIHDTVHAMVRLLPNKESKSQ